jgi:hypothetical protein
MSVTTAPGARKIPVRTHPTRRDLDSLDILKTFIKLDKNILEMRVSSCSLNNL